MKLHYVLYMFGMFALAVPGNANPPKGYYLSWSDEFSGNTLDTSKWDYRHSSYNYYIHSHEEDYYSTNNVTVTNGCLVLTETTVNGTNYAAQVSTENSFNPTFGYFETRMQSAQENATVSAFWIQTPGANRTNDNPTANGVEMDIIEDRPFNNSADNALHWNSYIPGLAKSVENWFAPPTPLRAFHVYGMLWTPTNCIFYVDGAQVWQTNSAISHRGEYIDLMVRSSHGRSPARFEEIGTTNTEARFDYVRYYTNALPSVGLAGILNSTASGNSMGKLKIQ